jgi:vesicle coat complex subunit
LDVNLLFILVPFFSICERITPRLAHANAAVVLSAVKVLMKLMEMLPADSDFVSTLTKKLAPPLVTLLSSEPEASYLSSQINKLASLLALLLFGPIQ